MNVLICKVEQEDLPITCPSLMYVSIGFCVVNFIHAWFVFVRTRSWTWLKSIETNFHNTFWKMLLFKIRQWTWACTHTWLAMDLLQSYTKPSIYLYALWKKNNYEFQFEHNLWSMSHVYIKGGISACVKSGKNTIQYHRVMDHYAIIAMNYSNCCLTDTAIYISMD